MTEQRQAVISMGWSHLIPITAWRAHLTPIFATPRFSHKNQLTQSYKIWRDGPSRPDYEYNWFTAFTFKQGNQVQSLFKSDPQSLYYTPTDRCTKFGWTINWARQWFNGSELLSPYSRGLKGLVGGYALWEFFSIVNCVLWVLSITVAPLWLFQQFRGAEYNDQSYFLSYLLTADQVRNYHAVDRRWRLLLISAALIDCFLI